MLRFERVKGKSYSKEQEVIFHDGENGLVCHMIIGPMTFDELVASVRKYYEQQPANTIFIWDDIVGKPFGSTTGLVRNHDTYKNAEQVVALALIRLIENDFVAIR